MLPFVASVRGIYTVLVGTLLLSPLAWTSANPVYDGGPARPALPRLDGTQTVSFTTDEGTWMSVGVSSDGGSIIFDLLGDIYTADIAGGTATTLLAGPAYEIQPVYSPDGSQIAFISDRDGSSGLWVLDSATEELRKISQTKVDAVEVFAAPAWSADGKRLFVSRTERGYRGFGIWVYDTRGGTGMQLVGPAAQHGGALGATASPDGEWLYYASSRPDADRYTPWTVRRRNLHDGSDDIYLTAVDGVFQPLLSPDGNYLAYGTRIQGRTVLKLRDLRTGKDRVIAPSITPDLQDAYTQSVGVLPLYSFTPDGAGLLISARGKIQRVDIRSGATSPIPVSVHVKLEVAPALRFPATDQRGPVRSRIIQAPAESLDAEELAFSALGYIYSIRLEQGARPHRVTRGSTFGEFEPIFSPDGRWIAYTTWSNVNGGDVWLVKADGRGDQRKLTDVSAYYRSPVFSRDGEHIYAIRYPTDDRLAWEWEWSGPLPQAQEIVAIPIDGGPARSLGSIQAAGPETSTDPGNLHLGRRGILFYDADGTVRSLVEDVREQVPLLKVIGDGPLGDAPASAVRLSPDERHILALVGGQLHLFTAPYASGGTSTIDLRSPTVPYERITAVGADYFDWSADGETILWAIGSTWHRLPLDTVDFNPKTHEAAQAKTFDVDVSLPRDVPEGILALHGATVLTMTNAGDLENADILVESNRIASVGTEGSFAVPADAVDIDLSGRFIVPGFVDTHAHWVATRRGAIECQPWEFALSLAYGITTAFDPQTDTNDIMVYADLIDAGMMIGPRNYSSGPGIFANNRFTSEKEIRAVLSRFRDYYGTTRIKSYLVGDRRIRRWLISASRAMGMMPTTEANMLDLAITHAIDGFSGNEHATYVYPVYEDFIELIARSGIAYSPTLVASSRPPAKYHFLMQHDPEAEQRMRRFMPPHVSPRRNFQIPWRHAQAMTYPIVAGSVRDIFRAGGLIGVGSHEEFEGIDYHWELQALASGGLTPAEVLQIATRESAKVIGRLQELGTVEAGKYADLVVLQRDPRTDIRNTLTAEYVVKNGRVYEAHTLDQVWPDKEAYPKHSSCRSTAPPEDGQ